MFLSFFGEENPVKFWVLVSPPFLPSSLPLLLFLGAGPGVLSASSSFCAARTSNLRAGAALHMPCVSLPLPLSLSLSLFSLSLSLSASASAFLFFSLSFFLSFFLPSFLLLLHALRVKELPVQILVYETGPRCEFA